jgi:hypothetical protein
VSSPTHEPDNIAASAIAAFAAFAVMRAILQLCLAIVFFFVIQSLFKIYRINLKQTLIAVG